MTHIPSSPSAQVDDETRKDSLGANTLNEADPRPIPQKQGLGSELQERSSNVGNWILRTAVSGASLSVMVVLGLVGLFLIMLSLPALQQAFDADNPLQLRAMGSPEPVRLTWFILTQLFGTTIAAFLALGAALPLAIGVSIALSRYLPRRISRPLGYLVDLLAAVPSVVFGLWGALVLLPLLQPVQAGLGYSLGFIPFFHGPASATGRTLFAASAVLAIMILPIITAIVREIMDSTPKDLIEAAVGLGATEWEVIKMVVVPHARSGIVSAAMLGFGRALGETMAVVMVLSVGSSLTWSVIQSGQHSTIAANIALQFPESTGLETSALVASGLALFAITLVVNALARSIVSSRRVAQ